jgi:hypothetical protein
MSFEEEFKQIDYEIRRLKVQYDLYFSGALARPPNDQKEALARTLRRYQGVSFPNSADRFLYNNVVNKFNTFQELWTKMLRIKEEGARVHPLAHRAAQKSGRRASGGSLPKSPPPAVPETGAAVAGQGAAALAAVPDPGSGGSAAPPPSVWRVPAGGADEATVRGMYDTFVAARRRSGDSRLPPFESFARELARHAESLRGRSDCGAVEFRIYSKDNKVVLKARPAGGSRKG